MRSLAFVIDPHQTEQAYDALLDALAAERARAEAVDVERASMPARPMAEVKEDEADVAREERTIPNEERELFRRALEYQLDRCRLQGDATYDSRDPDQDAMAGMLTRYLVSLGYAEVETRELDVGHYTYRVRVFWDRLQELAERSGTELPR